MYKSMKIKNLKNYGIPSYIVNICGKHYFPYLLPIQEDAVRNYGILNCKKMRFTLTLPSPLKGEGIRKGVCYRPLQKR